MKFVSPDDKNGARRESRRAPSYSAREMAIRKAIEKQRTAYIHLKCGHTTDWDIDLLYSVFRPLGKLQHFCETCGKWVEGIPPAEKEPLPDEPLF